MLFIKASIGAGVVLLISYLSKSSFYYVAALVPLFPTFALISNVAVYSDQGIAGLQSALIFGMFSLIPYFVYLISVYILVRKLGIYPSLVSGILFWCLTAFVLIYFWQH